MKIKKELFIISIYNYLIAILIKGLIKIKINIESFNKARKA